jgi:hypothetical protein
MLEGAYGRKARSGKLSHSSAGGPKWGANQDDVSGSSPGRPLPTWDEALDAITDEDQPLHVAGFAAKFDAQGVPAVRTAVQAYPGQEPGSRLALSSVSSGTGYVCCLSGSAAGLAFRSACPPVPMAAPEPPS